ncbi:cytochrome c3 family protein [Polycladidibacter stylochi]|uniref:cytochrome c3 family protein n=1 Tax=Polycladidibacter stylochi TaxID=1807766 RepID=UPI00138F0AAB|nr:cytochrome c3 family protein [Pseudovibrio stylochi]
MDIYSEWKGSQHHDAMLPATPENVLGDFSDIEVRFGPFLSRFWTENDRLFITLPDADGQSVIHQITHSFGVHPLQQYMVRLTDGRYQFIPFAWDSRSQGEGGQRWFILYPDVGPSDTFYWRNAGQNWNFMCADCHSTGVEKGYEAASNHYKSSFSEVNVGCEGCHGPALRHVKLMNERTHSEDGLNAGLAQVDGADQRARLQALGLERDLEARAAAWHHVIFDEQKRFSRPIAEGLRVTDQLESCAPCHSRRRQLNERNDSVQNGFLSRYLPSLITAELYHADGQIFDENYVFGSFLQSKMYRSGVSCSDCHNPHSAKLKLSEPELCTQCHDSEQYAQEKHGHHEVAEQEVVCSSCHMREEVYMQHDARKDHSFQVPRPDLSLKIGTPNACNACHTERDARWADQWVAKWFPESRYRHTDHFALAFHLADQGDPKAERALSRVAQDRNQADIIRASALQRLAAFPGQNAMIAIARGVKDENELVRLGAAYGAAQFPIAQKWKLLMPLINDRVLAVRAEAAGILSRNWAQLSDEKRQLLEPALQEYQNIQSFSMDRGFGNANLGNLHRVKENMDEAIKSYENGIRVEPQFEGNYLNLADLLRQQSLEGKGLEVLERGIAAQPHSSRLLYARALTFFREKENTKAIDSLRQAISIDKENPQYWYVLALALQSESLFDALIAAQNAYAYSRDPRHLYLVCELHLKNRSDNANACLAALARVAPDDIVTGLKRQYAP